MAWRYLERVRGRRVHGDTGGSCGAGWGSARVFWGSFGVLLGFMFLEPTLCFVHDGGGIVHFFVFQRGGWGRGSKWTRGGAEAVETEIG